MVPFGNPTDDDADDLDVGGLDNIDSKWQVPDGIHEARVVGARKDISKAGNPMVVWTLALTGNMLLDDGSLELVDDGEHAGKEFRMWMSLTPAALFKVKEIAEALDMEIVGGRVKAKLSKQIGKQCMVEMETREYEGRESSSTKSLTRHADGPEA